jgi:flavin reductase (DIM6/NTAB) family NADH-FMN oxidoreductase RutF
MFKEFNLQDILSFEQRYRATFINSIGGFKSVALIGTKNSSGQTNLAIFNSLVHIGANPPLLGFIVRPDSVERHTLENILETNFFTVNHITENFYLKAHQTSARYPRNISEFEASGLTEYYRDDFHAPFVEQSPVQIAVEFQQKTDLTINGTILIIGLIKFIRIPQVSLSADGFVDLNKSGTITCVGLDAYYKTDMLSRLSYAKPDKHPTPING